MDNTMQNEEKLPGFDRKDDGDAIVRAIEENTRVLLGIKSEIKLLAETLAAKADRKAPKVEHTPDRTIAGAIEVYKACPEIGLFKRSDIIRAMDPASPVLQDLRRLSCIIKGLTDVMLLTGCGWKGSSMYQKVPGVDEATALERIGSKAFRAGMNRKGGI